MSGRKARQYADAQRALASLPSCHCGAGEREEDGRIVIYGHSMDCQQLKALGVMSRTRCTECGRKLRIVHTAYLTKSWCRFGHIYSMSSR